MKRVLLLIPLLLPTLALAQQETAPTPETLAAQLPALRVAATLKLRQDQVDKLKPLLEQLAAARTTRDEALSALADKTLSAFAAVDGALLANQKPRQADVNAVEKAAREQKNLQGQYGQVLDSTTEAIFKVLDKNQASLIEPVQAVNARLEAMDHFNGSPSLAHYLSGYFVAMRKLLPDEYEALRVAMGLRLAGLLVPPADNRYNQAVSEVLRMMDTVRRMTDADFSQRENELPAAVARGLRLNPPPTADQWAVSREAFLDFVAGKHTLEALAQYKAAPALEVQP